MNRYDGTSAPDRLLVAGLERRHNAGANRPARGARPGTALAGHGAAPTTPRPANLTGKITVLFHGPAGTGATSRQFEAALLAGAKTLADTNNAASLLANANFFKQIQGNGTTPLPPCVMRPRSAGGGCI